MHLIKVKKLCPVRIGSILADWRRFDWTVTRLEKWHNFEAQAHPLIFQKSKNPETRNLILVLKNQNSPGTHQNSDFFEKVTRSNGRWLTVPQIGTHHSAVQDVWWNSLPPILVQFNMIL